MESPFTSVPAVFRSLIPYCGLGRIMARITHIQWPNTERIEHVKAPTLFISGTKDNLTPNWMAHELFDLAKGCRRKEIYDVIDGKHSSLYRTDREFWNRVG